MHPAVIPLDLRLGRTLLAFGTLALGVLGLIAGDFLKPIQPVPVEMEGRFALAYIHGAVLAGLGAALLWDRTVKAAATALTIAFGLWFVVVHIGAVWATPGSASVRVAALEVLVLAAAYRRLAGTPSAGQLATSQSAWITRAPAAGRIAFGLMVVVFGVTHLMYREAIAGMVPAWMPGRAHWPWVTGVVQVAAGAALLSGAQARLAALLVATMFGSWIFLVHAQRLAAQTANVNEWVFALMAVLLTGAALVVASSEGRSASRSMPGGREETTQSVSIRW